MHTQYHRESCMGCGPVLGGLNQVYGPNHPTPSVQSICGKYINTVTRYIRNQHDMLKTAVTNVSKRQTDMSHQGELQPMWTWWKSKLVVVIYLADCTLYIFFCKVCISQILNYVFNLFLQVFGYMMTIEENSIASTIVKLIGNEKRLPTMLN